MKIECIFKHAAFSMCKITNKNQAGYTCRVTKITDIHQKDSIQIVAGEHDAEMSNRDVVGIAIQNIRELNRIPHGFGQLFPRLQFMQIVRCSIEIIKPEDFIGLENLQGLWLDENLIIAIPNDLFENVEGLKNISFRRNKLKYIGENSLKPLKNLLRANFTENTRIDMSYDYDPEQLRKLNVEIATKCAFPTREVMRPALSADSSLFRDMQIRIASLEEKIRTLETDNVAKKIQIGSLEHDIIELNNKMECFEGKINIMPIY